MEISWIIPTILSIANVLILAYNIKLSRDSFQLKQWTEMLQQSGLLVKLEGITDLQVSLTNVGKVPMDEIRIQIEGSIESKNGGDFSREFTSKTILPPKEISKIPLFQDLEPYLIEQKLLNIHYDEVPSGERDLIRDEMIFVECKFRHIPKPFSMRMSLETVYKVHKVAKKIPKEFLVFFGYVPEYGDPTKTGDPECRYSDNYEVRIQEVQWTSRKTQETSKDFMRI